MSRDLPYPSALGFDELERISRKDLREIHEETRQWKADNPGVDLSKGPLARWRALEALKGVQEKYEAGDQGAILWAIHLCAVHGVPLPAWCAKAFTDRYRKTKLIFEYKSWDEVFGKPHPKGTNTSAKKKRYKNRLDIYIEVTQARKNGTTVDSTLFQSIGNNKNLGKTLTEEYYYSVKNWEDTSQGYEIGVELPDPP